MIMVLTNIASVFFGGNCQAKKKCPTAAVTVGAHGDEVEPKSARGLEEQQSRTSDSDERAAELADHRLIGTIEPHTNGYAEHMQGNRRTDKPSRVSSHRIGHRAFDRMGMAVKYTE